MATENAVEENKCETLKLKRCDVTIPYGNGGMIVRYDAVKSLRSRILAKVKKLKGGVLPLKKEKADRAVLEIMRDFNLNGEVDFYYIYGYFFPQVSISYGGKSIIVKRIETDEHHVVITINGVGVVWDTKVDDVIVVSYDKNLFCKSVLYSEIEQNLIRDCGKEGKNVSYEAIVKSIMNSYGIAEYTLSLKDCDKRYGCCLM